MVAKKQIAAGEYSGYGMTLAIWMLVGGVVLSVADVFFLQDVIARLFDESIYYIGLGVAILVFLAAMGIMVHLGVKYAHRLHEPVRVTERVAHYVVWLSLGIVVAGLRLDTHRELDAILALLLFFIYVASGWLALDGAKNLVGGDEFKAWDERRKREKEAKGIARAVAEATQAAAMAEMWSSNVAGVTEPLAKDFVQDAAALAKEAMAAAKDAEQSKTREEARAAARKARQKSEMAKAKADAAIKIVKMPIGTNAMEAALEQKYSNAYSTYTVQMSVYKEAHDRISGLITQIDQVDQDVRALKASADNMRGNIKAAKLATESDITMRIKHGERGGK